MYKFGSKSDQWIFLRYFSNSRAYRVYNLRTKSIMETINVVVDDNLIETTSKPPKTLESRNEKDLL